MNSKASERHKADLYYRKEYGVTLAEHEENSKNGCEICGGRSAKRRLHADHSHKLKYMKVDVRKNTHGWWVASIYSLGISSKAEKRNRAIQLVREMAKRLSYRGALCFPCNGGLRKFRDNPQWLENAAKYLRRWQAGLLMNANKEAKKNVEKA